jgi:hypothetical protein
MSNPFPVIARSGGEYSGPIQRFLEMSAEQRAELARTAPKACQGGMVHDPVMFEQCIESVCDGKKNQAPSRLWNERPPFFEALRANKETLFTLLPQDTTAFRHYIAKARADKLCKDPPDDGNRAVVTAPQQAPVPNRVPLAVALIGLAALAAVRLGSMIKPELRPAAPSLIQGIYLWMGLTPPEESIAPPIIDDGA